MTAFDHADTAEVPMTLRDSSASNTRGFQLDAISASPEAGFEDDADVDEFGADEPFAVVAAPIEDADIVGRSNSLFEGDEGTLTYDQRRTLVFILKHRYISAEQHPAEWQILLDARVAIRSRLNDLFLDLHIDRDAQISFKRQAVPEGDGRFPTLLQDIAHTREETILLVFLRERFRSERFGGGDVVYVDRDELLEAVERFRPPDANDRVADARRVENAVVSLQRSGLLLKTADEQRLRIAPVIEVLLPLPRLHQLLDSLWRINGTRPAGQLTGPAPAPDELDFDASKPSGDPDDATGDPR